MVRQTAALICCHAASRGVVIEPALAKEIALDVHVDVEVPLGHQCVNTEVLNVRAGPSKDTELLSQIQEGQRVEVWGRIVVGEDTLVLRAVGRWRGLGFSGLPRQQSVPREVDWWPTR